MNFIQNLRLARRMTLGFGVILALLVFVTALAIANFRSTGAVLDQLLGSDALKAQAVSKLEAATRANATRTMELLITDDAARLAMIRERIAANREAVNESLETLQRLVVLPEARERLKTLVQTRERYVASFQKVAADVAQGQRDAARQRAQDDTIPLLEQLIVEIKAMDELMQQVTARSGSEVRASVETASTWWRASARLHWCSASCWLDGWPAR